MEEDRVRGKLLQVAKWGKINHAVLIAKVVPARRRQSLVHASTSGLVSFTTSW